MFTFEQLSVLKVGGLLQSFTKRFTETTGKQKPTHRECNGLECGAGSSDFSRQEINVADITDD